MYPNNSLTLVPPPFNLSVPLNLTTFNVSQSFSFDGLCHQYYTYYKDNRAAAHASFYCVNGSYIVQQPPWTNFRYGNKTQNITRNFL